MTRHALDVTYGPEDGSRVPDCLLEGVAVLADLLGQGVLGEVGEKVRIRRQFELFAVDLPAEAWPASEARWRSQRSDPTSAVVTPLAVSL